MRHFWLVLPLCALYLVPSGAHSQVGRRVGEVIENIKQQSREREEQRRIQAERQKYEEEQRQYEEEQARIRRNWEEEEAYRKALGRRDDQRREELAEAQHRANLARICREEPSACGQAKQRHDANTAARTVPIPEQTRIPDQQKTPARMPKTLDSNEKEVLPRTFRDRKAPDNKSRNGHEGLINQIWDKKGPGISGSSDR